jgi:cation transport ATPase
MPVDRRGIPGASQQEGTGSVDESMITGEPITVEVFYAERRWAGK